MISNPRATILAITLAAGGVATAVADTPKVVAERAAALVGRGDLAAALDALQEAKRASPGNPTILGPLGDVCLDLGRVDDAELAYRDLAARDASPETAARLARLERLKGDFPATESHLREALARQQKVTEAARAVAPYQVRLGDLLFDSGRPAEAEREYKAALRIIDAEHAKLHEQSIPHEEATYFNAGATAGIARTLAARGDAKKAERTWKLVATRTLDPALVAEAGDFLASIGRAKEAEAAYARAEAATGERPEHRRTLARFLADHDRKLDRALALAEAEAAARADVETLDLLAWALHKNGKHHRAAEAIDRALKVGTKDARLLYHAGAIHRKAGLDALARQELEAALSLNPHFSPIEVPKARAMLESLAGPRPRPGPPSGGSAGR